MKTIKTDPRRRLILSAGGGLLLSAIVLRRAGAADEIEIEMSGTSTGSAVWFRPNGLWIRRGQAVRWVNRDTGNVHTTTAYHPDNHKPLRIPESAHAWDSGYLLPKESFVMTFNEAGVYDYFCTPHEHAGMVGRIVVGAVDAAEQPYADTNAQLPAVAVAGFPDIASILKTKR
jgi:plastocyanin